MGLAALIYIAQYAFEIGEVFPLNGKKRRRRRRDDEDEGIYGQVGRSVRYEARLKGVRISKRSGPA